MLNLIVRRSMPLSRRSTTITARVLGRRRRLARTASELGVAAALLLAPLLEGSALAQAPAKVRVAFIGDSLAQNYWAGMRRIIAHDPCLKAGLDLGNYTKAATGLSRSDNFNWFDEVRRVNATYHPTLTLISIGLNDRQGIIDQKGVITQLGAAGWSEKSRQLVDEFLIAAYSTKPIILFVGLPAMRAAYFHKDMMARSAMYEAAVAKFGQPRVQYVTPWKADPAGPDTYQSHGLDRFGKRVQLRSTDGIHVTAAGEEASAAYLLPKVLGALAQAGIKVDQCPDKATE